MNYEEKRELRIQISQLLADAGVNQKTIKELLEEEIRKKVNRAFEQEMSKLNSESQSGDYIQEQLSYILRNTYLSNRLYRDAVKEEIKNRVIHVTIGGAELEVDNGKT